MRQIELISKCHALQAAYQSGSLGYSVMPEDASPSFTSQEARLTYFTLPMSLNYQRDSYKLWESALKTYDDPATSDIFSIQKSATMPLDQLKSKLLHYKVALQPNKHLNTWRRISETVYANWGSLDGLFKAADNDLINLKELVQITYKKGFPYLSGPKIFNYWSFIVGTYGRVPLLHRELIDIAPDTHIIKGSVLLGIITSEEAVKLSRDEISNRWRIALAGSGIDPIDMHPPLWFWSRNGFTYQIQKEASQSLWS